MKRLLIPILLILFNACSVVREIPIETVEKIVVRDSIIYVSDTVTVPVPYEVIKEIVPQDTVSILNTKLATSEAKIEKGMLHHKLEQKGAVSVRIDTFYVTQIKEVEKLVEVPVQVEVVKYKRDSIFWISIILNIVGLLLFLFRMYLKFKV